jgi:hypothetical protein
MTREQMVMFATRSAKRKEGQLKFEAAIHGAKLKGRGLDTDDAQPIEELLDSGSMSF